MRLRVHQQIAPSQLAPPHQQFAPLHQQLVPPQQQLAPLHQQLAPPQQQLTPLRQQHMHLHQQCTPLLHQHYLSLFHYQRMSLSYQIQQNNKD